MGRIVAWLALLCLCGLPGGTWAQERSIEVQFFGEEDGLSHREVNALYQDEQKLIWLGTLRGLDRFDGHRFRHWSFEHFELEGLRIYELEGDAAGRIWLAVGENPSYLQTVFVFDPKSEKLEPLRALFPDLARLEKKIEPTSLIKAADGALWMGTREAGLIRHWSRDSVRVFGKDQGIYCRPLAALPDCSVWVHWGRNKLVRVATNGEILATVELGEPRPDQTLLPNFFWVWGNTLYGSWSPLDSPGLFWQISPTGKKQPFRFPEYRYPATSSVRHLRAFVGNSETKQLWSIHARPGMVLIDSMRGRELSLPDGGIEVKRKGVRSARLLSDGQCLVGGDFGFYFLREKTERFQTFVRDEDLGLPYAGNSCRGLYAGCDELYVNCRRGFYMVDLSSGNTQPLFPPDAPRDGYDPLFGLFLDDNEEFWVGGDSLFRLPPGGPSLIEAFPLGNRTNKSDYIWSIQQDQQGDFWLGTLNGLRRWDGKMKPIPDWSPPDANVWKELMDAHIYNIVPKGDGFWVCSGAGLYYLDPQTESLQAFQDWGDIPKLDVYSIYEDPEGTYWMGTAGQGLIEWNGVEGEFRQFSVGDGLPSDIVYAAYADCRGRIWMSTDNGVACLYKESEVVRSFQPKGKDKENEYNRISHFQDEDGKIYFGGVDGVTVFQPCLFPDEQGAIDIPLLLMDVVKYDAVEGESVSVWNVKSRELPICLKPKDPFLIFRFALLDFREVGSVRYAFQLDQEEDDWQLLDDNKLELGGLSYGEHLLRVRGLSSDGRWSSEVLEIPIVALAPFYLKPWFILSTLALLGVAFMLMVRYRVQRLNRQRLRLTREVEAKTRQIQRQADELRSLEEMKSRFFANISHDLRTPLTLILGPLDSLRKKLDPKQDGYELVGLIQENGKRLRLLIDQLLDLTKLQAGKLEVTPVPVNLHHFIRGILKQYRHFAESKELDISWESPLEASCTVLLDAGKLDHILNNLLSNAIKFTEPGDSVRVRFWKEQDRLLLSVTDTGRGIPPEELPKVFERYYSSGTEMGAGIGLSFSREIAHIMEGTLDVSSTPGERTTFLLNLPLQEVEETMFSEKEEMVPVVPPTASRKKGQIGASRILVVEDHPGLLAYLRQLLAADFTVVAVSDGQKAWEKLEDAGGNQSFDLILSDLMMPRLDGLSLLEKVRTAENNSMVPFLLLTARADLEDRLAALRIGVDDYLVKPFSEQELLARINNLLALYAERKTALQEPVAAEEEEVEITADDRWLAAFKELVQKELKKNRLSVSWLASEMNLSERQLQRKLKVLTGLSPSAYIREVRMRKARRLLERKTFSTIAEVAYEAGFKSPSYFSRLFFEHYGQHPSDYLQ